MESDSAIKSRDFTYPFIRRDKYISRDSRESEEEKAKLKSELSQIKSKFGHDVIEEMAKGKKWRQIKKKHLMTIGDIESINAKITLLDLEIDKHPKEIRFDEAHGKKLVELNYERERFLDAIKVFTYNMEKQMCKLLLNYWNSCKCCGSPSIK